jgi:hypothetical protein
VHVAGMGDKQNFAGKTSWEILLLEDREGWHYNVTMCLREIGCVVRRWLELAQDRVQWRGLVLAGIETSGSATKVVSRCIPLSLDTSYINFQFKCFRCGVLITQTS